MKYLIWIITLFALSLAALAFDYNITAECEHTFCYAGGLTNWQVNITNQGSEELKLDLIWLIDPKENVVFGLINQTITVTNKKTTTIEMETRLPRYSGNKTMLYNFCYNAVVDASKRKIEESYIEVSATKGYCDKTNHTLEVGQCSIDNDCSLKETCAANLCLPLKCENCSYSYNHKCRAYQCCESRACKETEMCSANKCVKLNCTSSQQQLNHSCSDMECALDETLSKGKCKKLNCSIDEGYINHSCTKLDCQGHEILGNHTCDLVRCADYEFAANHTCFALSCSKNETATNHTCMPIKCGLYKKLNDGICILNTNMVFLSFEPLAFIAIVGVGFLIFLKVMNRPKK